MGELGSRQRGWQRVDGRADRLRGRGFVVPQQLPPPPAQFTNRHRELSELSQLRGGQVPGQAPRIVILRGPGGVGKTALALRWLHESLDGYPDGALYAALRRSSEEPVAVEEVLGEFLRALGVSPGRIPATLHGRAGLYRSVTAGLAVAVLLEDAVSAAQVKALVPSSASSFVLVTSRLALAGLLVDGATAVAIDPLDADSALDLLRRRVGAGRVEAEARPARALVRLCGGLPIALCVAAAQLALRPRRPVQKVVTELENRRLDALSTEDMSVRATLDLSYRALDAEAAAAYRAIGVHPGSWVCTELVAAMQDHAPSMARRVLDALVDASLLTEVDDELYRCHDLVRAHTRDTAASTLRSEEKDPLLRRGVEWHLRVARDAGHTVMPSRPQSPPEFPGLTRYRPPAGTASYDGALAWLQRHRQDLVASMRAAADLGWHELVYALGDALQPLLITHKHHRQAVEVDELAMRSAIALNDYGGEVNMRKRLARALVQLDETSLARQHIDTLIQRSEQRGDRRAKASGLKSLGRLHTKLRQHALAVEALTETVAILHELDHARGEGLARSELGLALLDLGQPDQAALQLGRARQRLSELDPPDPYNMARATVSLAVALLRQGELDPARQLLKDARATLEQLGADYELGRAHQALAELHEVAGDGARAQAHRGRADEIFAGLAGPAPDADIDAADQTIKSR